MRFECSARGDETAWHSSQAFRIPSIDEAIPARLILSDSSGPSGRLIFFFCGIGGAKENAVPPGVAQDPISSRLTDSLLRAGYDVVVIDNPAHGERVPTGSTPVDALAESIAGEGPDLIARGRTEAKALVDWALDDGLVTSPAAIGLAGQSWGGYQAISKFIGDSRIACCVAVIPVVAPEQLEPFAPLVDSPRLVANDITAGLSGGLLGRPLLVLSGRQDTVSPLALTRIATERWRHHYRAVGADDRLQHVALEGVSHGFAETQSSLMVEWFDRYMVAGEAHTADTGGHS